MQREAPPIVRLSRTIARFAAAILPLACFSGCAYVETRNADVSSDPKFQVGYHNGQVYRLRTPGWLVEWVYGKPAERLDLQPPTRLPSGTPVLATSPDDAL